MRWNVMTADPANPRGGLLAPDWIRWQVLVEVSLPAWPRGWWDDDRDELRGLVEDAGLTVLDEGGGTLADHCETCTCERPGRFWVESVGRTPDEAIAQIRAVLAAAGPPDYGNYPGMWLAGQVEAARMAGAA